MSREVSTRDLRAKAVAHVTYSTTTYAYLFICPRQEFTFQTAFRGRIDVCVFPSPFDKRRHCPGEANVVWSKRRVMRRCDSDEDHTALDETCELKDSATYID